MVKSVRWRYVLFEIVEGGVSGSELPTLIWRQIYSLFGTIEGSKFGFRLLDFDEDRKIGIARVSWKYLNHFRVVLATLNMQKEALVVNEILVSGTQASLKRKFNEERLWSSMRNKFNRLVDELKLNIDKGESN